MQQRRHDSIAALCREIWALEEDFDLLDREVDGVRIWQASRMYIYYRLAARCGLYEFPHPAGTGATRVLKGAWALLRGATIDNPFLRGGSADIGVFDHTRPRDYEGRVVDIYSWFLCRDLEEAGRSFLVFERPFLNENRKRHELPRRRVGIIDQVAILIANALPARLSPEARSLLDELETAVDARFGVTLDLRRMLAVQLRRFKLRRWLYGRLLDRYRVREVYVVVAYFLAPLVDACRQRSIPVHEIQHGVINKYHLGYSFPGRPHGSLHYFPDDLLQWGGRWPTTRHLPLAPARRIDHGFRFFEANAPRFARIERRPDRAVVVSQSVHGNALARYLREHRDQLEGWRIRYKLHPSEFNRVDEYADLHQLAGALDDFTIVEQGDVHELLAEAAVVIGVFSTALFEALEFGCRVYVVPLEGWEYMDELLEDGTVRPFAELPAATRDGAASGGDHRAP